ncbi:MAG: Bug family tripartite tricarboxylate transporter substrate binding protein [Burkholderiales bacterium]
MRSIRHVVLALAFATIASGALAQEFPAKPIRLMIPFPPGGGTDFVSRIVANKLAETLKWNVVPENRPGASGNIAIEATAKSPADGYTIVMGQSDNMMLGPWLYPNVGYDTVKSFVPIVQVSRTSLAMVSAAKSPLASPADLVAKGKSPAGLSWATAGNGSVGHVFGEQFQRAAGIKILQVPYKGATPALADVMGGQIDVAIMSVPSVLGLVKSGKLTAVAVSSAQRSAALPATPTLDESGQRGLDVTIWLGLFAPIGTPAPIIARLNAEVNKVLQSPDVIEKVTAQGVSVAGGSSEDFAAFVRADYERWGRVVKESGVKLE